MSRTPGTSAPATGAVTPSYPQLAQVQAPPVETYNIPPGTLLRVRIDKTVGTKHDRAGERFTATLNTPVIVDGREALPRGTLFAGHLTNAAHSGSKLFVTATSGQLQGDKYR
jgi:hypothetical protein